MAKSGNERHGRKSLKHDTRLVRREPAVNANANRLQEEFCVCQGKGKGTFAKVAIVANANASQLDDGALGG